MACTTTPSQPINLYSLMEENAKAALAVTIPQAIATQGIPVTHMRPFNRAEDDVYGESAGTPVNRLLKTIGIEKVLMGSGHWRAIDYNEGGYFEDPGYLYCTFDLLDGDVIVVNRVSDKLEIQFVATQVQALGNTDTILKRFKMSNISGT